MNQDLIDLGDYFPGRVPPLVGDLWTLVLERAFEIEVVNDDGRLLARGSFALRCDTSLSSAEEAVAFWRRAVEPKLRRSADAVGAMNDITDPQEGLQRLLTTWVDFFDTYFLNEAAFWIESARTSASDDWRLAGRGQRVRRRQQDLTALGALSADDLAYEAALGGYLEVYGAYSAHPELLHMPYPRDNPSMLKAEISLVRRPTGSPLADPVEQAADDEHAVSALLAIAEDDNHYKYEACYGAHRFLLHLGASACELGKLSAPEAIFDLDLISLERLLADQGSVVSAAVRRRPSPLSLHQSGADLALRGEVVVPGQGTGSAWRVAMDSEPPESVILIVEGLGSLHAGSLLPFAEGLLARHGNNTSHCALIARELGRPVIVLGDALDQVADGSFVTIEENGVVHVSDGLEVK